MQSTDLSATNKRKIKFTHQCSVAEKDLRENGKNSSSATSLNNQFMA